MTGRWWLTPILCALCISCIDLAICGTNAVLEEHCGSRGFYCRSNSTCVPRRLRCPSKRSRHWTAALQLCPKQADCHPMTLPAGEPSQLLFRPRRPLFPTRAHFGSIGNRFMIYTGISPISSRRAGRRRKRGVKDFLCALLKDPWKHSFVQYRGFVYEFGTYGLQELDINDPDYKYNRELVTDWRRAGTSTCTYRDVKRFQKQWKTTRGKYSLFSNNCHSFTRALLKYLQDDCKDLSGSLSIGRGC